jgi:hypothetical protein
MEFTGQGGGAVHVMSELVHVLFGRFLHFLSTLCIVQKSEITVEGKESFSKWF